MNFSLVCEGTSDASLVEHLKTLLVLSGIFDEVSGDAPNLSILPRPPGNDVRSKIEAVLRLNPDIDLLFVHRDSDSGPISSRVDEIARAIDSLSLTQSLPVVEIIPVRMLESWLLVDHDQLRKAAGASCRGSASFPAVSSIEGLADPKSTLKRLLVQLSGYTGTRLKKFNRTGFYDARHYLVQNLDPNGPVINLPSYIEFKNRLDSVLSRLAS